MSNSRAPLFSALVLGAIVGAAITKLAYERGILAVEPPPTTSEYIHSNRSNLGREKNLEKSGGSKFDQRTADARPLPATKICELQELMKRAGTYDATVDGLAGPNTEKAIRDSERLLERPISGRATIGLLKSLRSRQNDISREFEHLIRVADPYNPTTGTILRRSGKKRIAPLELRTKKPGTRDYLVKLDNIDTKTTELIFFVRGGESTTVDVPLGKYEIKYANGYDWMSINCLFGSETSMSKAKKIFDFKKTDSGVAGYTVILVRQREGNLETAAIKADQW